MPSTRVVRAPDPAPASQSGGSEAAISLVVHTLGTARIEAGTTTILPTAAKRFAFLLYLAAERQRPASRTLLQELLFPHLSETNARHALRELLYELRQLGIRFDSDSQSIALDRQVTVRIDSDELRPTSRVTEAQLSATVGGWLPEYAPIASERFTTWYEGYRTNTIRSLLHVLFGELTHTTAGGNWERGERIARACLALDPLNERATFARAELIALGGDRSGAVRFLDGYVSELGHDAAFLAPEIAALRRRIAALATTGPAPNVLPFTGRAAEMTVVTTALQAAWTRGVQTVLLWGDSGIGKSRILDESASRVELEGGVVLRLDVHPHDAQRPMGVFADLVPLLLRQRGALGCSPTSMRWLHRLGVEPAPRVERTDRGDHAEQVERIADEARVSEETANAIARAVLDVLTAIAAETRLVLIVDDVQWIDPASLGLIRDITRGRRPVGLAFLLAARTDALVRSVGQWGDHFVARHVGPLEAPAASSLLKTQLSPLNAEEPSLVAWMTEAAAGNPFYLDILLAHYRTTGERFTVPERLSAIIDQRVDELSREARSVLEAVVSLGRYATVDRLEGVLSISGTAIMNAARELETGRFIVVAEPTANRLQPFHWLVAESVQRNATPVTQQILYRRIASRLESEAIRAAEDTPDSAADGRLLWACAEAWVIAGEAAHAADLLIACAARAMRIGRAAEAAELYLRAASLLPVNGRDEVVETAIRVAAVVRESATVLRAAELLGTRLRSRSDESAIALAMLDARMQFEEDVLANLDEIEAFARDESIASPQRLEAARMLVILCSREGIPSRAIGLRDTLRSLVIDPETASAEARLASVISYESMYGDQSRAPALCRILRGRAETLRPDLAAVSLLRAGLGLIRSGEMKEALAILEQAYVVANRAGLHATTFEALMLLSSFWLDVNERNQAELWLERLKSFVNKSEPSTSERLALTAIDTEFALCSGDMSHIRSVVLQHAELAAADFGLKGRRWKRALGYLGQHLNGARLDTAEVDAEMRKHHVRDFEAGDPGDFEMAVTVLVYADNGDLATGRERLLTYIDGFRRFGFPLTPFIRSMGGRVGIDETTMTTMLARKASRPGRKRHSLRLPANWPNDRSECHRRPSGTGR